MTTLCKDQKFPKTFLDIAGIAHDENSWSNIYAYFLRNGELGRIFLNSLLRLITLKTNKEICIDNFVVEREVVTHNQNRIDLLIKSKSHSIIIENKVHHILNNDLEDYWLSVKGNDLEKTGVLLTLTNILTNHPGFVNITHKEWMDEIQTQLKYSTYHLSPQEEIIFNDFCRCIMKETKSLDTHTSKMYLEKRETINNLVKVASEAKNGLMRIFTDQKFIRSLKDFTLVHSDRANSKFRYVMYKLPNTRELVITILYEFLWNSKPGEARILFLIEPLGKWLKKANAMADTIVRIVKEEGIGYNYSHNKCFWHCGGVECHLSEDQILDERYIKDCIKDQLINPSSKLMKAAKRIAETLSSTHIPSYSWEDALAFLKTCQKKIGGDDFAEWVTSGVKLVLYDRKTQVVVLEAKDVETKSRMEKFMCDDIEAALKYAFGENVRYSIITKRD